MYKPKWKATEKARVLIKLSTLLKQGYTLSDGIELLALTLQNETQTKALYNIIEQLRNGSPIHVAFEQLHLPNDILAYLYFAERYGDMITGLHEAGKLYLKREEMKEKLLKLLRYPLFLIWFVIILSFIMVQHLFPHFKGIYSSISLELPLITRLFLQFIDFIPLFLLMIFLCFSYLLYFYWWKYRRWSPHKQVSTILKIPVFSQIVRTILTYFFALQLSGLLKGGMQISQALQIFMNQNKIPFFRDEVQYLISDLQQGESLVNVLRNRTFFTPEFANIVLHGQQQSQLDKELSIYSEMLFQQLESKAKRFIMIVQPSIFMVVGVIVIVMFAALFMPMFELINSLN